MAELSPAAQAALNAFDERHELCGPFDGNWQELCIAAAFRAAAYRLADGFTVRHDGFKGEYEEVVEVVHVDDLLAIAAELEMQP